MTREEFRPRTGLVNMKSKAVVGDRSLSCSQPELYAFLVMPWRVLLNEKCVLHVKCKSDQFHRPFRLFRSRKIRLLFCCFSTAKMSNLGSYVSFMTICPLLTDRPVAPYR